MVVTQSVLLILRIFCHTTIGKMQDLEELERFQKRTRVFRVDFKTAKSTPYVYDPWFLRSSFPKIFLLYPKSVRVESGQCANANGSSSPRASLFVIGWESGVSFAFSNASLCSRLAITSKQSAQTFNSCASVLPEVSYLVSTKKPMKELSCGSF